MNASYLKANGKQSDSQTIIACRKLVKLAAEKQSPPHGLMHIPTQPNPFSHPSSSDNQATKHVSIRKAIFD